MRPEKGDEPLKNIFLSERELVRKEGEARKGET